jgi:Tfp pilus assembly protein PilF
LAGSSASLSEVLDQADEAEQDGDAETARRLYEIAAMARPRDAVIRYNLGCILIGLSRLDEAETHLRIAAGIDSLLAEAWFNIAHIRRLKGDADGEKLFLERALDADPDYADALVCLAKWFIARDAFDKARPLLDRIERAGGAESQREFVRKAVLLCDLAGRS